MDTLGDFNFKTWWDFIGLKIRGQGGFYKKLIIK